MKTPILGTCWTGGEGLYCNTIKPVNIVGIDVTYLDDNSITAATFGELRVYFEGTERYDEMVYTDPRWIFEFRKFLQENGFSERAVEAIDYSEAGMQGSDYISLDIGDPFIIECDAFMNFFDGKNPKRIPITVSALD